MAYEAHGGLQDHKVKLSCDKNRGSIIKLRDGRPIMEGSGCWQCPLWLSEGTSCSALRAPSNRMKGAVNRCCRLYLGYRTCLQWKWGSWHGERVRCDTVQQAEWNRQHTPLYTTLHVHYVINQFRQANTLCLLTHCDITWLM